MYCVPQWSDAVIDTASSSLLLRFHLLANSTGSSTVASTTPDRIRDTGMVVDARASTTIPVSRLRSGVVEATVELPVLLAKRWNRNNNDELAVSITVSDHCGTQYITSAAEALGPAWTVGEGLFAGKKWKGGFLSIPDRTGALEGSPKNHFLLHPSCVDDAQIERLMALGLLEADVQEPKTVQMDAQHDAISLRVFACSF